MQLELEVTEMFWELLLVSTLESSKHLHADWPQDDDLRVL